MKKFIKYLCLGLVLFSSTAINSPEKVVVPENTYFPSTVKMVEEISKLDELEARVDALQNRANSGKSIN